MVESFRTSLLPVALMFPPVTPTRVTVEFATVMLPCICESEIVMFPPVTLFDPMNRSPVNVPAAGSCDPSKATCGPVGKGDAPA